MENKDWDKINEDKRLSILKGQTLNQAWNWIIENEKETDEQIIIERYIKLYNKLLKVNKKLLGLE